MKQQLGTWEVDLLTQGELKDSLGHMVSTSIREQYRGVKAIKLPIIAAAAGGTTLVLPPSQGAEPVMCGPESGYFWRVGRVTVASSGVDVGAVSLFAGSDPSNTSSQFLVDNTLKVGQAYYPGARGLFLWPGEFLYASITSVSGNMYRMTGVAVEVPAEMAGKILAGG